MDRTSLRKQMRQRRQSLSDAAQRKAATGLLHQLRARPEFIRARHIAFYLPNDGEIDPQPVIRMCWRLGKTPYLPVLHPVLHNRLWFIAYRRNTPLRRNSYGIKEPKLIPNRLRPAWALDLVMLPLVAFDPEGNRMGMGGGYYDRTFAFKQQRKGLAGPTLIGLAHELQKVERLPVESWDIPLNLIVTDQSSYPKTDG